MTATIRQIVTDAEGQVGEVAGSGVQSFSDDNYIAAVVRAFDLIFKKRYWEQYSVWFRETLDGTLGVVGTSNLEGVRDFEDFQCVMRDGYNNPLPILAGLTNPYAIPSGTQTVAWTSLPASSASFATKRLQFYPVTSTEILNIRARVYPKSLSEEWIDTDTIYFDKVLMSWATTFQILASDDTNANAAQMAQGLMEIRYKDILAAFAERPLTASGYGTLYPQDYRTAP